MQASRSVRVLGLFLAAAVLVSPMAGCSDDTTASKPPDLSIDRAVDDGLTVDGPVVDRSHLDAKADIKAPGDGPTQHDASTATTPLADHTTPNVQIPAAALATARQTFGKIFYGHTSHGSQIVTGLEMLQSQDGAKYAMPTLDEYGGDLGQEGDTAWVAPTKAALNKANNGIKMVVWSWCGGVSGNTEAGINTYLSEMDKLEKQYPNVVFVYMTGHLDGTGPSGSLYRGNNQIRAYCKQNGKALFDFADIESYDPAGTYYPNESDACGWCSTWCSSHTCPSCSDCAHSHCFNCYRKGQAFWWLLARLSGWKG